MKRRAFLTMLGLAPVVAQALPRPANPANLAKGGSVTKTKYIVGEQSAELLRFSEYPLVVGKIRSKDNKMVLHLSEGRITFRD